MVALAWFAWHSMPARAVYDSVSSPRALAPRSTPPRQQAVKSKRTEVHDVVTTNGTVVDLDVCTPQSIGWSVSIGAAVASRVRSPPASQLPMPRGRKGEGRAPCPESHSVPLHVEYRRYDDHATGGTEGEGRKGVSVCSEYRSTSYGFCWPSRDGQESRVRTFLTSNRFGASEVLAAAVEVRLVSF